MWCNAASFRQKFVCAIFKITPEFGETSVDLATWVVGEPAPHERIGS
jgi:hypothetical protein